MELADFRGKMFECHIGSSWVHAEVLLGKYGFGNDARKPFWHVSLAATASAGENRGV